MDHAVAQAYDASPPDMVSVPCDVLFNGISLKTSFLDYPLPGSTATLAQPTHVLFTMSFFKGNLQHKKKHKKKTLSIKT